MQRLLSTLVLLFLLGGSLWAQLQVRGTVTDAADGSGLPGATIKVAGTNTGTVSGADGSFSISVSDGAARLMVSYTGYKSQEIVVNGRTNIDIVLESGNVLEDVVIVGYGTQTKKELTGSVSKITGDAINRLQVANIDAAIAGQAPGVQVVSNSGTPGGAVSVRVRGPSSISASNQPLYVIDGIPINTGSYAQLGTGNQTTNALAGINMSDIASIEVLKDAAAASIYGARASNGVVLITTKRGQAGKTKVSFNASYGNQKAWRQLEPLTGTEYTALVNEARRNRGQGILFPDSNNVANTNWQNEVFRTAPMYNADLSFSGGTERTRFMVSANYFDQEGTLIGSKFNRFTTRFNLDNYINDKLKLTLSSSLSQSKSTRINNDNNIYGVLSTAVLLGSHIPTYNADGTYGRDPNSSVENPIAAAIEPTFDNPENRVLVNAGLEWTIIKGLSFRTNFGADNLTYREFRFYPNTTNAGAGVRGQGFETYARDFNLINENVLNWKYSMDNFKIDLLGGVSFQNSQFESIFTQGEGFPGNTIRTLNAASVKKDIQSNRSEWGINSQFLRANFGIFDDRYVISAIVRRDGSSRFGADKRYGIFPGVSAAWNLIDESFMKGIGFLSNAKIKVGWGVRGNANIGDFASRGLITAGANYNQIAGLAPTQLGNPGLSWEERSDLTAGIDLGFVNNRINLSVEWYQATTENLLLNRPLVGSSGFTGVTENVGSMKNTGIDLGLGIDAIQKDKFSWRVNANFSYFQNEITDLVSPFASGFASWVEEGQELGSFRGYRVEGIFQTQDEINALNAAAVEKYGAGATYQVALTRPGDIKFRDLNNDGRITADDQEIIGSAQPDFFGGVTNEFKILDFDFSFFFQGQFGNEIYNNNRAFAEGMNSVFGQLATVRERWTPSNPSTTMPRAVFGDPNNNRRTSDRWLEDGSFVRLRNVTLGYTLPKAVTERIKMSGLRIYVAGQNLLTFTNYSGFDPEVSTFAEGSGAVANTAPGTDFLTFPVARTITFGINANF